MNRKKILKAAYKERRAVAGVFQVRNTKNGKLLIEGSTDVNAKWNRYRTELRFGSHRNKALQKDWRAHTEDAFEFEILSKIKPVEDTNISLTLEVKALEEMLLEELNITEELKY